MKSVLPYVTTEFKIYQTIPNVLISITLSTSQKWTSFLSREPCSTSTCVMKEFSIFQLCVVVVSMFHVFFIHQQVKMLCY